MVGRVPKPEDFGRISWNVHFLSEGRPLGGSGEPSPETQRTFSDWGHGAVCAHMRYLGVVGPSVQA